MLARGGRDRGEQTVDPALLEGAEQADVAEVLADQGGIGEGVNAAGTIAGAVHLVSGPGVAVWDGDDVAVYEAPAEAVDFSLRCSGITEDGRILVSVELKEEWMVYLYEDGTPTQLEGLSRAWGINTDGVVVGVVFGTGDSERHAAVWADGQAQNLNELISPDSGLRLTDALAINDAGAIAVMAEDADGTTVGAVLLPAD